VYPVKKQTLNIVVENVRSATDDETLEKKSKFIRYGPFKDI